MHEHTYDNDKLNALNKNVARQWEDLFRVFGITDYYEQSYYITAICPVHYNSDNESSFNFYPNESNGYPPGMWRCNTAQCHDVFGKNMIGLTRGLLSKQRVGWSSPEDKTVSFEDTVNYLLKFLKTDYSSLSADNVNHGQNMTNSINVLFSTPEIIKPKITRDEIRASLDIPATYYMKRGYSAEILSMYDIGLCTNREKTMYNRVVVPIYDKDWNYVGCTGRSIFDKCEKCNQYHNPYGKCVKKGSKWLHSKNSQAGQHLYNYCYAQKYIKESQIAILVEGVGDVLKLVQSGIQNCVALFGTSLSAGQFKLLNQSGALSLIVLLDNDKAGKIGMNAIQQKCGRLYRTYYPTISAEDVGELTKDEITSDIKVVLDKIKKEII